MKSIVNYLKQKCNNTKNKLLQISAKPHEFAMGYAMGIFLAASPLIGIKVFIAMAMAFLFKWNKVAAIIGIFHINPLTGPLFYGFSFIVGKLVTGLQLSVDFSAGLSFKTLGNLFTSNFDGFICLLTGGVIIGLPLAVMSYFIIRSFLSGTNSFKKLSVKYT